MAKILPFETKAARAERLKREREIEMGEPMPEDELAATVAAMFEAFTPEELAQIQAELEEGDD